jgi:hypothetical protein
MNNYKHDLGSEYKLHQKYFPFVKELLKDMPLIIYTTEEHFLVVYTPSSSVYQVFSETNDYLCKYTSHLGGSLIPENCNLYPGEYFNDEKMNKILQNVKKITTFHHENFQKHQDKFIAF